MTEIDFWSEAWSGGNTPWHGERADAFLRAHFTHFASRLPGNRILVPLCGNSFVVRWLWEQGFDVTGVEFVESALEQLLVRDFSDLAVKHSRAEYVAPRLRLICSDFFSADIERRGFDMIYDRGALVAVEPTLRGRYAARLRELLAPSGIIALESLYFAGDEGPPFSISSAQVDELFPGLEREELVREMQETNEPFKSKSGLDYVEKTFQLIG